MLEPGEVFDRYRVESLIGEGGMAAVYRVRHTGLSSVFAMKVLKVADHDVRVRLEKEARVQSGLHHPNIVAVHDVIDVHGAPAIVMELVEGPSLAAWAFGRRLTFDEIDTVFRPIIGGIGFAHHKGLVHRDLKPSNILLGLGDDGHIPKIADFGLAKLLADDVPAITRSDVAMGTPAYMAPEQIQNPREVDQRADLFAIGCILYELCAGQRPFKGENPYAVLYAVMGGKYIAPEALRRDLPPRFADTIRNLLRTDPADRIQSTNDLKQQLWPDRPSSPGGIRNAAPRMQLTVTNSDTSLPRPSSVVTAALPTAPRQPVAAPSVALPPPPPLEAPIKPTNLQLEEGTPPEDQTEPFGAPLTSRIGVEMLPGIDDSVIDVRRGVVAVSRPDLQARISHFDEATPAVAPKPARPMWPWLVAGGVVLALLMAAFVVLAAGGTAVALWQPWASAPAPVAVPPPAEVQPVVAPAEVAPVTPAPPKPAPEPGPVSIMFMSSPAPGSAEIRCENGYLSRQVVAGGRAVWTDVPAQTKCTLIPRGMTNTWGVSPGDSLQCLTEGESLTCA